MTLDTILVGLLAGLLWVLAVTLVGACVAVNRDRWWEDARRRAFSIQDREDRWMDREAR